MTSTKRCKTHSIMDCAQCRARYGTTNTHAWSNDTYTPASGDYTSTVDSSSPSDSGPSCGGGSGD